jgi:hypothetical protein
MNAVLSRLRTRLLAASGQDRVWLEKPDVSTLERIAEGVDRFLAGAEATPPVDKQAEAIRRFHATNRFDSFAHAVNTSFGCGQRVTISDKPYVLLADAVRLPRLIELVDAYHQKPRPFARCYRGLLASYFHYDVDFADEQGKRGWQHVRQYLRDRRKAALAIAATRLEWMNGLARFETVFDDDPCRPFGRNAIEGVPEEFEELSSKLTVPDSSWLVRRYVMAQVDAAVRMHHDRFRALVPQVLELLSRHEVLFDEGLAKVLDRYHSLSSTELEAQLRDVSVKRWGNPWLTANQARWGRVRDETRAMVATWLKLGLLEDFFQLLAHERGTDRRRLRFWSQYVHCVDDMYLVLGSDAKWNRGADYMRLRERAKGRIADLTSSPASNNAFVMVIGKHVVVEFGETGNACFVFRREGLPFRLASGADLAANRTALKHDGRKLRLRHMDRSVETWEDIFDRELSTTCQISPHGPGRHQGVSRHGAAQAGTSVQPPSPTTARHGDWRVFARGLAQSRGLVWADRTREGGNFIVVAERDSEVGERLKRLGFTWSQPKGHWFRRS